MIKLCVYIVPVTHLKNGEAKEVEDRLYAEKNKSNFIKNIEQIPV